MISKVAPCGKYRTKLDRSVADKVFRASVNNGAERCDRHLLPMISCSPNFVVVFISLPFDLYPPHMPDHARQRQVLECERYVLTYCRLVILTAGFIVVRLCLASVLFIALLEGFLVVIAMVMVMMMMMIAFVFFVYCRICLQMG